MAVVRLILRLSSSRPRPLAAGPALLRLVVLPCLNAHKRHVRDPLYSFNSLLEHAGIIPASLLVRAKCIFIRGPPPVN